MFKNTGWINTRYDWLNSTCKVELMINQSILNSEIELYDIVKILIKPIE